MRFKKTVFVRKSNKTAPKFAAENADTKILSTGKNKSVQMPTTISLYRSTFQKMEKFAKSNFIEFLNIIILFTTKTQTQIWFVYFFKNHKIYYDFYSTQRIYISNLSIQQQKQIIKCFFHIFLPQNRHKKTQNCADFWQNITFCNKKIPEISLKIDKNRLFSTFFSDFSGIWKKTFFLGYNIVVC